MADIIVDREIQKAVELRQRGVLSQQEFDAYKAKLLGSSEVTGVSGSVPAPTPSPRDADDLRDDGVRSRHEPDALWAETFSSTGVPPTVEAPPPIVAPPLSLPPPRSTGSPPEPPPPGYPLPGYSVPFGSQPSGYQTGPTDAFGRPLAGWWPRALAIILDTCLICIPVGILANAVLPASMKSVVMTVLMMAAALIYFGFLDGRAQTVGKRALGIAVRSEQTGNPIGVGWAIARRAVYLVLWYAAGIPGIINAMSPLWDSKRQAWHDHAAGSVVIKVR